MALLGLPDDSGVKLNGGRGGADDGPRAFRQALSRYGAAEAVGPGWPAVYDAGDVEPGETIEQTHDRVTEATAALLDAGLFPVAVGGGHDLTFAFVRAVAQRHEELAGVYFDAHLDVRSELGSGMSFRKLVEDCGVKALYVHGLHNLANSREHMRWFESNGGRTDDYGPTDPWPERDLFVSFDLDVMDQAFAPGVSAPNPHGWTPAQAERWVFQAGRQSRVRCFDLMELNPRFDQDSRTARLAAHLFLFFLQGFAERG